MNEEIIYWSASQMLAAIGKREISVTELVQAHIDRAERVNPAINAIVTSTYEQALIEAKEADQTLAKGQAKGALFGLPVAHKDNQATKGVRTTYGSLAFAHNVPSQDSIVVARQKAAGAISLGKTNLPDLGAGSHTFNEVFGASRNPYNLDVSVGGSSGGSAAALAAGLVALADGTDLGGSLRNPASFCNVVGLRPSIGRVAHGPGAFAFNTMSVAGPMGRCVQDVALFLDVLAGDDARDPMSLPAPAGGYRQLPNCETQGLRIALSPSVGGLPLEPAVQQGFHEAVGHLQAMGCHVEQAEPDFSQADFIFETYRAQIFSTAYRPLRERQGQLLKDTVRWNIDLAASQTGHAIADAERLRSALYQSMQTLLTQYDFIVAPVSQVLPFAVQQEYPTEIDGVSMPHYLGWMRSCSRISVTGHPAISIPCAFSDTGLPIGIQIIGKYREEAQLLAFAAQFEEAAKAHLRRPTLTHASA